MQEDCNVVSQRTCEHVFNKEKPAIQSNLSCKQSQDKICGEPMSTSYYQQGTTCECRHYHTFTQKGIIKKGGRATK